MASCEVTRIELPRIEVAKVILAKRMSTDYGAKSFVEKDTTCSRGSLMDRMNDVFLSINVERGPSLILELGLYHPWPSIVDTMAANSHNPQLIIPST